MGFEVFNVFGRYGTDIQFLETKEHALRFANAAALLDSRPNARTARLHRVPSAAYRA